MPNESGKRSLIRIGTRRSDLARIQTDMVIAAIKKNTPDLSFEIVPLLTSGDKRQGTPDAGKGDKKEWVIELEMALLDAQIDIAVHSGKDVPVQIEEGTALYPVLDRAPATDALLTLEKSEGGLMALSKGAKIGTASLRRSAQLRILRPDIHLVEVRGNVPTRIKKLESGEVSALILAEAGLARLSITKARSVIDSMQMVPAMNQGILAAQVRASDQFSRTLLEQISPLALRPIFLAERDVIRRIGADCKSAVGVFAEMTQGELKIFSRVCSPDGAEKIEAQDSGSPDAALDISARVAEELLLAGARRLLASS